jgi:hypothetical protein
MSLGALGASMQRATSRPRAFLSMAGQALPAGRMADDRRVRDPGSVTSMPRQCGFMPRPRTDGAGLTSQREEAAQHRH